ncbi:Uncharacterized protein dnl_27050 [Desulfonema limicola]|uniref:Lipoprotein n=1 Tax=Desulfonema limicola TaxID=45656 RepID=A0A975B847_9BACT|nr:hypothetical protein [Desulfonema limicola]QTA80402.1 Uncharacterized protein dnl_27050 [Desulfonema limicola]
MKRVFFKLSIMIISVLYLTAGCTHMGLSDSDNKHLLIKRVQAAWEAKINKDWGIVYDMSVDAYKKKVKRDDFIRRANINVEEFSIEDIKIIDPGKKAVAHINQKIKQMGFDFTSVHKEEWLWENGNWYLNLMPLTGSIFENRK